MGAAVATADWTGLAEAHFGGADLGDARRARRLVRTAGLVMAHPGGTLPEKLPRWADLNGLYRLAAADAVTHAAVIRPHLERTRALMGGGGGGGVVLLVHDTTELDFTTRRAVSATLGQIGNGGGRGYLCHNTLAVRASDGAVLGLAAQVLHERRRVPKGERAAAKRDHPARESLLWRRGCERVGPAPAGAAWVDVCDRGADAWEFPSYAHAAGRHYVVRAAKDRRLDGDDHVGGDRVHGSLHGYARDLPTLATRTVGVGASTKKGSKARTAAVRVAAGPVTLAAPAQPRGHAAAAALDLWVVHVAEVAPPAGVAPVEWVLLTNVPAGTPAAAAERVDWYARRPTVEDFHKGMKTGLGVERPQFESAAKLEPVVGLLSVVAAVLLGLRHAARHPDADLTPAAAAGVPDLWSAVVAAHAYRTPGRPLSAREFVVGVARLGGFLARKNDGPPGWLTLWRGWAVLHQMVAGAELAKARCV